MFIFIAAPRAPAAPTVTSLQAPGKHPASHPSSWDVVWLSNKGKTFLRPPLPQNSHSPQGASQKGSNNWFITVNQD